MFEESTDLENINIIKDPTTSWYFRRFLAVSSYPEKFPTWKIENNRLYHYHDDPQSGHLGTQKTYLRIATDYFWPGCYRDVNNYVRKCNICQSCKVEQKASVGFMGQRIVEQPWIVVAADIMGPFPRSKAGYQYVLVIQDFFTKWVEFVPLRSATGLKIKNSFKELIIDRWRAPQVLLTDNGTEFINSILRSLAQEYNILHTTTPPYHPQANPVERVNRILKTMIVSYNDKDHNTWDEHLSEFRFAYNTAYHTSLQTTPAFLNFGRDPKPINSLKRREELNLEIDPQAPELWNVRMKKLQIMRDWIIKNLDSAFKKQAHYYNLRRRQLRFSRGDLVLTRCRKLSSKIKQKAAKLNPKFIGPYKISKVLSPTVFEIEDLSHNPIGKIHIQNLKPYITSDT